MWQETAFPQVEGPRLGPWSEWSYSEVEVPVMAWPSEALEEVEAACQIKSRETLSRSQNR